MHTAGDLLNIISSTGVYELQVLTKSDSVSDIHGDGSSSLLARFFTIIGPANTGKYSTVNVQVLHHF